ncbi:MAG: hypothetical protein ACPGVM_06375 [Prochlorococcaceae cyanobacterium]
MARHFLWSRHQLTVQDVLKPVVNGLPACIAAVGAELVFIADLERQPVQLSRHCASLAALRR